MNTYRIGVFALIISALSLPASAALIVDGSLGDWGVTVADHNQSNFTTWTSGLQILGSHVEDQDDEAGHSFVLGPNAGGQDYDAEMMAIASQGSRYFICVVTGMRPDNGFAYFSPGDIRIETSAGTFGIEVGGGKGGNTNPGTMITAGAPGSTYTLNSNGEAQVHTGISTGQVAGSIWHNAGWILDPIAPHGAVQLDASSAGTYVGLADYTFTRNAVTSQHAIIELSFEKSLLGGAELQGVYWRPSCGNDELNITGFNVPEPATLLFMAMSGVFMRNRRR